MDPEAPSSSAAAEEEHLVASVAVVGVAGAGTAANDSRGRHRILAELNRLEQEISSLEVFSYSF